MAVSSKNFLQVNRRTNVLNLQVNSILGVIVDDIELQVTRRLANYTKSFQRSIQQKKGLREANKEVADLAREAMLLRYLKMHSPRSPYREADGDRFSGGVLLQTLANPQFVRSNAAGIQFGNSKLLDANAKQWYRLNFGAGQRGEEAPAPKSSPMIFFNRSIGSRANLSKYGPSKAFNMPAGFFSSDFNPRTTGGQYSAPAGMDAFYLSKKGLGQIPGSGVKRKRPTAGIKPMRFLEAGTEVINIEYPPRITALIRKWDVDARQALKLK